MEQRALVIIIILFFYIIVKEIVGRSMRIREFMRLINVKADDSDRSQGNP